MSNAALINVCAVDALLVKGKPLVARATKAADAVLAASVLAEARKIEAFVQVNKDGYYCITNSAGGTITRSFWAELLVGLGARSWTGFTVVAPCLAHGAATDAFPKQSVHRSGTPSSLERCVAGLVTKINAFGSSWVKRKSWWAIAFVRAFAVDTETPSLADVGEQLAFVDVCAGTAIKHHMTSRALPVFLVLIQRAKLTGATPGLAHRRTAL